MAYRVWDPRDRRGVGSISTGQEDIPDAVLDDAATKVATLDADTIQPWDLTTRKRLWSVPVPESSPYRPYFSPDGRVLHSYKTLVTGGPFTPDGRACASLEGALQDVATGKQVDSSYGATSAPAISKGGLLAVNANTVSRIGLWTVKGPTPLRMFRRNRLKGEDLDLAESQEAFVLKEER